MQQIAILVRHGESEANAKGIISRDINKFPLTPLGREQARNSGKQLAEFKSLINGVYSSPLLRAQQTAQEFLTGMNLSKNIEILEGLTETYFGEHNNTPISEFPVYHKKQFGIEPFEDNGKRILKTIMNREGINLYFSHMLPIKATVCNLLDIMEEDARSIIIKNASLTVLEPENGKVHSIGALELSERLKGILHSFSR